MNERGQAAPAAVPRFEFHIDELILHGFRPVDRYAVAEAIERELARLFSEGDLPNALQNRSRVEGSIEAYRLDAGTIVVPHDAAPDVVGVQVARAIHSGLRNASDSGRRVSQSSVPMPTVGEPDR